MLQTVPVLDERFLDERGAIGKAATSPAIRLQYSRD
jgi:hypothetical protein